MTNTFRNRLIGSIIVAAAGIIIIPSILDGQKTSYKDDFKPIPARPEFRSVQSAKTFPEKEFKQQLPTVDIPVTDDVAQDTDSLKPVERKVDTAPAVVQSKTVLDTDTLSVATISKPTDFSNDPGNKIAEKATEKITEKVTVVKPVVKNAVKNTVKNTAKTAKKAAKKTTPFSGAAWVIQLGAFGKKSNATALERKLNKAGFVTFSRAIKNKSRDLTKVYVGPELDKKVLESALAKVNQVAGVKGTLVPFTIKR